MALLPDLSIDQIHAQIMRLWSQIHVPVPMTKSELRQLLVIVDGAAETSDADVIQQIPAQHPARAWLIDNQPVARRVKERVENERAEVL